MYIVLLNADQEGTPDIPEGSRPLGVNADNEHVFDSPVNLAPAGFRAAVEADVAALPLTKARQSAINATRDAAINGGVEVEGVGLLDTGAESQMRQTAALLLTTLPMTTVALDLLREQAVKAKDQKTVDRIDASKVAVKVSWIKQDNTSQDLGFAELKAFGEASAAHVSSLVHDARQAKDSVAAQVFAASKKVAVAAKKVVEKVVTKPVADVKVGTTAKADVVPKAAATTSATSGGAK